MHVLAAGAGFGDRPDDTLAEIVRVRTRKTQPSDSVDSANGAQEIGKIMPAVEV